MVAQVFEAGIIIYDPGLKHDHPDARHTCYLLKATDPFYLSLLQKYVGLTPDQTAHAAIVAAATTLQDQASTITQLQAGLDLVLGANQHALQSLGGK